MKKVLPVPGYLARMGCSCFCCNEKIYGKTVLNEEIYISKYQPKIDHNYVKVGRNDVHYMKVLKFVGKTFYFYF